MSQDGHTLTIMDAVRGWSYQRWRVGVALPARLGSAWYNAHSVRGSHDHFVVSVDEGHALHRPASRLALPPARFWWSRILPGSAVLIDIGEVGRGPERALLHLGTSRLLHVAGAVKDGACRLAVVESKTGAFTGDRAAADAAVSCGRTAKGAASPSLLADVVEGKAPLP